jgi:hypothetical protein
MQLKTTEELTEIWEQNDHEEWSDTAFDVVKKILKQRTGKMPSRSALLKKTKTVIDSLKEEDIELDGSPHLTQEENDADRTAYLQSRSYRVLRFSNHDVMNEVEAVVRATLNAVRIRC